MSWVQVDLQKEKKKKKGSGHWLTCFCLESKNSDTTKIFLS